MSKLIDLTGQRFGRLTVMGFAEMRGSMSYWHCRCECGAQCDVRRDHLLSGEVRSCKCLSRELSSHRLKTHGMTNTRLWRIWAGMKQRCYDPSFQQYPKYGGRGITVCDAWYKSFQCFYDWAMTHGYNETLTIDRIDVNGNYCPENCRWATSKEQGNNKRNNYLITFEEQQLTAKEWSRKTGIHADTIRWRLNHGWPVALALTQQPKTK